MSEKKYKLMSMEKILADLLTGTLTGEYHLEEVQRSNEPYDKGQIRSHYGFDVIRKAPKGENDD
ncbi:hypothetical protein ACFP1L_12090 [Lactiplantibacillus nangangensis]|uniref:Uncharacterized protein n=1 Tax=Lactiplantibacillus nangangensis TaxID=2559917 RepID=A0ABW1SM17_9LACO|nr:hypothetical protein [Lactiplantibacillus nangangensis]